MGDQIVVSENGHSGIAIPLYRNQNADTLMALPGFVISLQENKPLAYVMDFGPEVGQPVLMNAEFVEKRFTFVGPLSAHDAEEG